MQMSALIWYQPRGFLGNVDEAADRCYSSVFHYSNHKTAKGLFDAVCSHLEIYISFQKSTNYITLHEKYCFSELSVSVLILSGRGTNLSSVSTISSEIFVVFSKVKDGGGCWLSINIFARESDRVYGYCGIWNNTCENSTTSLRRWGIFSYS